MRVVSVPLRPLIVRLRARWTATVLVSAPLGVALVRLMVPLMVMVSCTESVVVALHAAWIWPAAKQVRVRATVIPGDAGSAEGAGRPAKVSFSVSSAMSFAMASPDAFAMSEISRASETAATPASVELLHAVNAALETAV